MILSYSTVIARRSAEGPFPLTRPADAGYTLNVQ